MNNVHFNHHQVQKSSVYPSKIVKLLRRPKRQSFSFSSVPDESAADPGGAINLSKFRGPAFRTAAANKRFAVCVFSRRMSFFRRAPFSGIRCATVAENFGCKLFRSRVEAAAPFWRWQTRAGFHIDLNCWNVGATDHKSKQYK